jgi:YidC/Oxa1 family membrane protein insertase
MKWMIGFMSFLFFWVPAGLCVYFITQGIYGIAERLFLERYKKNLQAKSGEGDAAVAKPSPSAPAPNSKPASWLKTTGKSKSKNR